MPVSAQRARRFVAFRIGVAIQEGKSLSADGTRPVAQRALYHWNHAEESRATDYTDYSSREDRDRDYRQRHFACLFGGTEKQSKDNQKGGGSRSGYKPDAILQVTTTCDTECINDSSGQPRSNQHAHPRVTTRRGHQQLEIRLIT